MMFKFLTEFEDSDFPEIKACLNPGAKVQELNYITKKLLLKNSHC
jgi:hypothetical protein